MRLLSWVLLVLSVSSSAWADRYYTVIYGYQFQGRNIPRYSHTFATFVRESDLRDIESGNIEIPTISWLPSDLTIKGFHRERGHNFSLQETLAIADQVGSEVRAAGPYEITEALYERAMQRIQFLESGRVDYQAMGVGGNPFDLPGVAINCIHAVSDIGGDLRTGTKRGFAASVSVTQHLAPYMLTRRPDRAVAARLRLRHPPLF